MFVARGPSDATRASERVSPANVGLRVWHGEGQALALREGAAFFTVARGPVPRDHWIARVA